MKFFTNLEAGKLYAKSNTAYIGEEIFIHQEEDFSIETYLVANDRSLKHIPKPPKEDELRKDVYTKQEIDKIINEIEYSEKDHFVYNDQLKLYPDADSQVLFFIADILFHSGGINAETIRSLFHNGYCYYFANMLKLAFNRGEVCWAAPYGHIVWRDEDGICYDIEGVTVSEAEHFIPIHYLGDKVKDFLHVRDVAANASQEDIDEIIARYLKDQENES